MTGELFINTSDAWNTFGVSMGDNFLSDISAPRPLKPFIENKSRALDGKDVIKFNARYDERNVTLNFFLNADTPAQFLTRKNSFENTIKTSGYLRLSVPALSLSPIPSPPSPVPPIFKLTYISCTSFAMNTKRTFCKMSIKFNEANPGDRD